MAQLIGSVDGSRIKFNPSNLSGLTGTRMSERLNSVNRLSVKLVATWYTAGQNSYASDPKYKKYVQQVEKCLNGFDNVHEWADCIAFLKQLLKVCPHCISWH